MPFAAIQNYTKNDHHPQLIYAQSIFFKIRKPQIIGRVAEVNLLHAVEQIQRRSCYLLLLLCGV